MFVVGFQKILQLSYVDKLLDDVQREFRDKFENLLTESNYYQVRRLSEWLPSHLERLVLFYVEDRSA